MKKGFTLIEFIVIISIFAIMASIALFNYGGFRSNVSLNNLAHDIGLTIRQAQVFGWANQSQTLGAGSEGIALDGIDPISANPIRFSDGVYFSLSTPKKIVLYKKQIADAPSFFIDETQDRVIDIIEVAGPNSIAAIYYAVNKNDLLLDDDGLGQSITSATDLSIAFSRPRPEALFYEGQNQIPSGPAGGDYVGIYIRADNDPVDEYRHVVIVSRTGEIDVQ